MDTQIISLSNQKGGVGKTTTCANLGIGLAREGKRVLLVDCDPQASLTLSLGWRKPETLPVTLAHGQSSSETACSCRRSDSASCGRGGLYSRQHCLIRRGSVAGYTAECAETGAERLQKRLLPCAAGLYAVAGHDDDQRTGGGRQRADSDHTALFVGGWTGQADGKHRQDAPGIEQGAAG